MDYDHFIVIVRYGTPYKYTRINPYYSKGHDEMS